MPRLLTVQTELYDPHAIRETCLHLGLPPPVLSEWFLVEDQFLGFLMTLPGLCQPVILDTLTGLLRCVMHGGEHRLESSLASFQRAYAQHKAQRDARLAVSPPICP